MREALIYPTLLLLSRPGFFAKEKRDKKKPLSNFGRQSQVPSRNRETNIGFNLVMMVSKQSGSYKYGISPLQILRLKVACGYFLIAKMAVAWRGLLLISRFELTATTGILKNIRL